MAAAGSSGSHSGCWERRLPPHSPSGLVVRTVEMHAGGEPLRIVPRLEAGRALPLLSLRREEAAARDHVRRALMHEPRGHAGMYGAVVLGGGEPDPGGSRLDVLFLHGAGYSTMCGHAVLALGRFALDYGLVAAPSGPETAVRLRCPCGPVTAFVPWDGQRSGNPVRFHSVPAFAVATDLAINIPGHGRVVVDIGYGGTFYAFLSAEQLGLDVCSSKTSDLVHAASVVTKAGLIQLNQTRTFRSSTTGSLFTGKAVQATKVGDYNAVIVEVSGEAFYTGTATFTVEEEDPLKYGFFFK
ncbi:T3HPD dehydratase, partial [Centropus unirufus]|nr:T3HPD dehydratase [Centropus unirufus]